MRRREIVTEKKLQWACKESIRRQRSGPVVEATTSDKGKRRGCFASA